MFTGIIERIGTVKSITRKANLTVLSVDVGPLAKHIKQGDSVAVNGVCLTAVTIKGSVVSFDLMKETIEKTSLNPLVAASRVNLELAMRADSRLGGHFVTGHIDDVATIKDIRRAQNYIAYTITVPKGLSPYFVNKGSVAVDGISLTVGKVSKNDFTVYLIPFTLKATTLGDRKKGDIVNIETDILAKYILEGRRKA